jgi:hypothetical protein
MTIKTIEYSSSLMVHEGLWRKLSWIAEIEPTDDPETETENLKNRVESLQEKFGVIPVHDIREALPVNQVDKRVETIIGDIELCAAIHDINAVGVQTGLLAYESAANSDPRIKAAYDLKMIQLKQKQ